MVWKSNKCRVCKKKLKYYQRKFCSRKCARDYKFRFSSGNKMKASDFKAACEAVWMRKKLNDKGEVGTARSYPKFRGGRNFSCPECGGVMSESRKVYDKLCPECGRKMKNVTGATFRKRRFELKGKNKINRNVLKRAEILAWFRLLRTPGNIFTNPEKYIRNFRKSNKENAEVAKDMEAHIEEVIG